MPRVTDANEMYSVSCSCIVQVYFIGALFATQFWGYLADRYGRRRVRLQEHGCIHHVVLCSVILVSLLCALQALYLGNAVLAVFGILTALAPYYGWMLALRALTGFASGVAIVE